MKITKPAIFRRLTDRLGLEPGVIAPEVQLLPVVTPTTDIDELLRVGKLSGVVTKDLSAAAGTYTVFHTVPLGKRWRVFCFNREATLSNTYVAIQDTTGLGFIILPAAITETVNWIEGGFIMEEGWTIGMATTGNVGDTAIDLSLLYEEEDAY